MDSHKNARLTPKGREEMMRAVVNGVQSYAGCRSQVQHHVEDGRQMGQMLPRRRRGWVV